MKKLLIVDDEPSIRFAIRDYFELRRFAVAEAADVAEALAVSQRDEPDVAIVDYRLPDGTALELLSQWRGQQMPIPMIVLTGYGSVDLAVAAIKEGADNFITKPVELSSLMIMVERALENERNRRVDRSRKARETISPFLGSSPAIRKLEQEAHKVLAADSPILIQGPTGSGKGVLASWLHGNGPRADEAMVEINCAGLSRELLESELFGYEKGAFTGAATAKPGLLEIAHRGTVFLDEIGDLDVQVQPKLLKVMEEKRFRRLGDVRDRRVDIRLIAATHQDLQKRVREGAFRRDLYFRLSTLPLRFPGLSERREDLPRLIERFVGQFAARMGRGNLQISRDAEAALLKYSWPGNVREMRNVLERAVLLSDGDTLEEEDLRFHEELLGDPLRDTLDLTLHELEVRHIKRILRRESGHIPRTAERLGVPRSTLYQKIKKLGLDEPGS